MLFQSLLHLKDVSAEGQAFGVEEALSNCDEVFGVKMQFKEGSSQK